MKHKWILDEYGNIDKWQFEYGDIHNGPKCELCGFTFCMHCNPEYMDSDDCPGTHPLVEVPKTMVKKIPPSMGDETNPCGEFIEKVCSGTELPKDDVLKVLLWLRDHGHIGIVGLMVESDYYPETAGTVEEVEVGK